MLFFFDLFKNVAYICVLVAIFADTLKHNQTDKND